MGNEKEEKRYSYYVISVTPQGMENYERVGTTLDGAEVYARNLTYRQLKALMHRYAILYQVSIKCKGYQDKEPENIYYAINLRTGEQKRFLTQGALERWVKEQKRKLKKVMRNEK